MTSSLIIEGKEYVPANIAAKNFEYSKEYLLLLIKQEKVDGKKFGNRWYVYLPSAESFFNHAKKFQKIRHDKIREERKLIYAQNAHATAFESTVNAHGEQRRVAVVETFAILLIGSLMGGIVYFAETPDSSLVTTNKVPVMEQLAMTLYKVFAGENRNAYLAAVAVPGPTTPIENESVKSAYESSMVVFRDEGSQAKNIEAVRRSFSDPVTVTIDASNTDTGIVIPTFKNREGEAYRFLMVPVTEIKHME